MMSSSTNGMTRNDTPRRGVPTVQDIKDTEIAMSPANSENYDQQYMWESMALAIENEMDRAEENGEDLTDLEEILTLIEKQLEPFAKDEMKDFIVDDDEMAYCDDYLEDEDMDASALPALQRSQTRGYVATVPPLAGPVTLAVKSKNPESKRKYNDVERQPCQIFPTPPNLRLTRSNAIGPKGSKNNAINILD